MSKDYAALVAQVIPVFALALILEMRSVVERFVKSANDRMAQGDPLRTTATGTVAWFTVLATVQLLLAGAELRALAVVEGSHAFWDTLTLPVAIVLVVTTPIVINVYEMIAATDTGCGSGGGVAGLGGGGAGTWQRV